MFICEDTLDDLMRASIQAILKDGEPVGESSRGSNRELRGVLLRLTNPRARLSHTETKGKVFSPIGELAWYLAGSNDAGFIIYYISKYKKNSEADGTIHGAYGPRLFSKDWGDQFGHVVNLLREKPSTKKAVIQLFDSDDLCDTYKDVPCTCTLQFLIRSGRLYLITSMRSNDAYLGLPHDVFSFTIVIDEDVIVPMQNQVTSLVEECEPEVIVRQVSAAQEYERPARRKEEACPAGLAHVRCPQHYDSDTAVRASLGQLRDEYSGVPPPR